MTFTQRYDSTIEGLDSKLSALIDEGTEIDIEKSGDVLKIFFEDKQQFIISPNSPVSQLWLSANYAGHRFNWSEEANDWVNEKSGEKLERFLSTIMSEKLGEDIQLDQ